MTSEGDKTEQEESRYGLFTDALTQASHKIINNILSQKAFAECLPSMKKKHPETLVQLHATFSEKVQGRLKEDLDELVADLNLKEKLDFLDKLDTEQAELSQGETVWRPTGIPGKDLLAYDVPALQAHKEELLSYLRELQAENEDEKQKITKTVAGISETEKIIENMLAKNAKTIDVLSSIPTL